MSESVAKIEKFASSSEIRSRAGSPPAVGGRQKAPSLPFTRGRAEVMPTPKIIKALGETARRDVFYLKVPKSKEAKEKAAKRSTKRKAIAWAWRTRRVNAPIYGSAIGHVASAATIDLPIGLTIPASIAGACWWWGRSFRRSGVRVDVSALSGIDRFRAERHARRFVKRTWPSAARSIDAEGVTIARMTYTEWTLAVDLRLTVAIGEEKLRSIAPAIERAIDGHSDSVRVMKVPGDPRARSRRLVVVRKDPHARSIAPPPIDRSITQDRPLVPIGLFELGDEVVVNIRQHLMIAGQSGSGKSVIVQILMRALTRIPWVSVIGLDMGFGATELGPWEDKVEVIGRSVEDAAVIFPALLDELERRGNLMAERGWKTWRCSPEEPFLAVVIDEMQVLTEEGYEQAIISLAKLLRKYGGFLVLATQYPTKNAMPPSVKQQLQQTIGLRVRDEVADRVMFGESAKSNGWTASKLPKHRFYIESDTYTEPQIGKGYFLDEDAVDEAIRTAPPAVRIGPHCDLREELGRPRASEPLRTVAEQVKEDRGASTRKSVLMALSPDGTHRREVDEALGIDQTTTNRHLKKLVEAGQVEDLGKGWYRRCG